MIDTYLAGASAEAETVAAFASRLESSGRYRITCPWWQDVAEAKANGTHPSRLPLKDAQRLARIDRNAILEASVFWLIVPTALSTGCWTELGIALADAASNRAMHVIVSGDWEQNIFCSWARHRFATHEEALAHLLGVA